MDEVSIKDKQFELYISPAQIQTRIKELAKSLNEVYANKNPILIIVLNGAFIFATPLQDHTNYNVSVKSNPISPLQTCEVMNNTSYLVGDDVTNVEVSCEYIQSNDLIYRFGFENEMPNM